jgi:preprotein translocase subunit SecE
LVELWSPKPGVVGSSPTTRAKYRCSMAKFKLQSYVKESYDELVHKVSWPSWSELQNSAIVVSIASLIIALIVYLMDFSFQNILELFYKNF